MTAVNDRNRQTSNRLRNWYKSVPNFWRYLLVVAVYLIFWGLLDKVALLFETTREVSIWYPPSALDFVLLFVFGLHYSPALLLKTLVHEYIVTPQYQLNFVTLTIFNLVTTLGYAGAATLLLLGLRINPRLRTFRDIVWFVVVAALAAPSIVAWLQVINFAAAGVVPWSRWFIYTLHYWAGDATGIAMLAPFLLIWLRQVPWIWYYAETEPPETERLRLPTRREIPDLLLETAILLLAIWGAYGAPRAFKLDYTYLIFLPIIWSAMRHGLPRASVIVLLINIGVAFLVRARVGPSGVLALQFCMMAVSQIGLLLGGIATQRRQSDRAVNYSAQRLKILHEIDRAILQARSPLEIADAALNRIMQLIPCQSASMTIFDFDISEFTVLKVTSARTELLPEIRLPLAEFGDLDTLQRGEINVVSDISKSIPLPASANVFHHDVRAYMRVPLFNDNLLIGSLNVGKDSPGNFRSVYLDVAGEVADQIALAMQQARLFKQIEQQANRERSLNQISQTLNSSLDPEQILQQIVRLTGECFQVDRVVIFTVVAEQLRVTYEWRANDEIISVLHQQIPRSEWFIYDFQDSQTFHLNDLTRTSEPNIRDRACQARLLSMLSEPISIREQFFGRLSLHTTTNYRRFTDDEINLLQQIAQRAAIALYNAQSYEDLEELVRQRTQELECEKHVSEAANRAKTDFLSNMSHELRTPLTSILGFSKVLLDQIYGSLNAKQEQYIERIHVSGKHLLALINDLLDLSKIEAGQENLVLETIAIAKLASECMLMVEERARSRNLLLSVEIASDTTTCVADRRRLKQILVNLLSNAVKFTETGSVTLAVEQSAQELLFSVIDTGIGIADPDLATLFQPFHQVDSGLNRKYEGTGLGLALSRRLAQLHGGDITVESELKRGSCFTLHLPVSGE